MSHVVVVHDPTRQTPVGTVVEGDLGAAQAQRRAVTLPVDPELALTSLSGYVQRYWGAGWTPLNSRLERACPMCVGVDPGSCWLYWAALIERIPGAVCAGHVRLVVLPGPAYLSAGMSQDSAPPEFEMNCDAFVVRGRNRVQVHQTGVMQVALHGGLGNGRVLMTALTRTDKNVAVTWLETVSRGS